MTTFEAWSLGNMIVQSVLLLATLIGAVVIGIRQNSLNRLLINLQYAPSVEVSYDKGQIQILNKGSYNIWLHGAYIDGGSQDVLDSPRLITPGGFYWIPAQPFIDFILPKLDSKGTSRPIVDFHVNTADERSFIIRTSFYCISQGTGLEIRPQTLAHIPLKKP